jgi:glycosyltransferase involved in cell wall biosynthesis
LSQSVTLFLQRRSGKAGAQVALARLITNPAMRALNPVLVTMQKGWLTEQCTKAEIPYLIRAFPKSRSWKGRLFANRAFGLDMLHAVRGRGWNPTLVQGNDHLEGLLAQEVMRCAQIAGVIFLRSSEMTKRDFFKYRCDRFDLIYAVGEELATKAKEWSPNAEIHLLDDGVEESEFYPPKAKTVKFPMRVLVVGSESQYKGWADLAEAVDKLEQDQKFPELTFEFTGKAPDPRLNDMHLSKSRKSKFIFIGRAENFADLVRQYDLVIHPSREESFGIAPMEILAAGVPLLCSRVGAIAKIRNATEWLFAPRNPNDLAFKLAFLHDNWTKIVPDTANCQTQIRRQFMMNGIIDGVVHTLQILISRRAQQKIVRKT